MKQSELPQQLQMQPMPHETETPVPQRPGQYHNLGWAALCALGGVAYAGSQSATSPQSAWLLGGILLGIALALLAGNRRRFYQLEHTGWWQPIEAISISESQRFVGEGWELDLADNSIHTLNYGRYGPVENTIGCDAITRVDVLGDGADLILTNEYGNPYLSIQWQFMSKAARVALLRWLRERAPQAHFSPFAAKIESGWFPQAVR